MTQWTRNDLPEVPALRQADDERGYGNRSVAFDIALDVVVEHLNRAHPKHPDWIGESLLDQARTIADLQRERDAAVERAEQAEGKLRRLRDAHSDLIARHRRLSDEMEQSAPAVSRADIEKAIRSRVADRSQAGENFIGGLLDAVWSLLSGSDPAVHVVRESNVEAQAALRNRFGEFVVNGTVLNVTTAEDCREKAQRHLDAAARCESIARAIEAGQAVDPFEELAGQIETAAREAIRQVCADLTAATVPGIDAGVVEDMLDITSESRRIAAHVLGQEASSDG